GRTSGEAFVEDCAEGVEVAGEGRFCRRRGNEALLPGFWAVLAWERMSLLTSAATNMLGVHVGGRTEDALGAGEFDGGGEGFGEGWAFDQFHREEVLAFGFADFVDADDAGMLQPRGGFGFAAEPLDVLGSGELASADHFEGDQPVQAFLPGAPNDAHATRAD